MTKHTESKMLYRAIARVLSILMVVLGNVIVDVYASDVPARTPVSLDTIKAIYHHRSWTAENGAPPGIWAMAQTLDGSLWLGTRTGLYRFDGVRFEHIDLQSAGNTASRSISTLHATPTGDLWVGYGVGGADFLVGGDPTHVLHTSTSSGIEQFADGELGHVWAFANAPSVLQFIGGRWLNVPAKSLPAGEKPVSLANDDEGRLWLGTDAGMYVLNPTSARFDRVPLPISSETGVIPGQLGPVVMIDAKTARRVQPASPTRVRVPSEGFFTLVSRDGSLWSTDCAAGICRDGQPDWEHPIVTTTLSSDSFMARDGLTSDHAMIMMEDREGNIWVGTKLGLDQFRRTGVTVLTAPVVTDSIFTPMPDGRLLVATSPAKNSQQGAFWTLGSALRFIASAPSDIYSVYARDQTIYFGGQNHLWTFEHEVLKEMLPAPPGGYDRFVTAIAEDDSNSLWTSVNHAGVFKRVGAKWVDSGGLAGLPKTSASTLATEPGKALWFGYDDGRVAQLSHDIVRIFGPAQGLLAGPVTSILPGSITLIGGDLGLFAFDGKRFIQLDDSDNKLSGVNGLIRGDKDSIWANTANGIVHIASAQWRHGAEVPGYPMIVQRLDSHDGISGGPNALHLNATAVAGVDGRLWFAVSDGLVVIDPKKLAQNKVAPNVRVTAVVSGNQSYSVYGPLTLPVRTTNVEFDYTAASLTVPERVRFRVMLSGVDARWRDLGNKRSVSYLNLKPGHYAFHVIASNNDDVWSMHDAVVMFSIKPAYYQSPWFFALCSLARFPAWADRPDAPECTSRRNARDNAITRATDRTRTHR